MVLTACDLGFSQYPVNDVMGCYSYKAETYTDTLCLLEDDQYQQIRIVSDNDTIYNTGRWRSFEYHRNPKKGPFTAVVLYDYQTIANIVDGSLNPPLEHDIQPSKDYFGKVRFLEYIGNGRHIEYSLNNTE